MIRETAMDNGEHAVISSDIDDAFDTITFGSKHDELRIHVKGQFYCISRKQVQELLPCLQRFAETGRIEEVKAKPRMVTLRWIEDGQEHTFSSSDMEVMRAQYLLLSVGRMQGVVEKIMLPEIEEIKQ